MAERKDLLAVVKSTGTNIDTLAELKEALATVPTEELVSGFLLAKDYSTKVNSFVDAVKKELVDNKTLTGRIFNDDIVVEIDEKGNRFLDGVAGDRLKAEKRVYSKLNVEKVKAKLTPEQYTRASDVEVVCHNPAEVKGILELVLACLTDGMDGIDTVDLPSIIQKALDSFESREVLNEQKLEALIALGEIDEIVEEVMDTTIQYALKKAPKKKGYATLTVE